MAFRKSEGGLQSICFFSERAFEYLDLSFGDGRMVIVDRRSQVVDEALSKTICPPYVSPSL